MSRRRVVLATWAAGLVLACGGSERLPEDLLGVWRHPDPAYADRTLEILPGLLVFGTSATQRRNYQIVSVESERRGATTTYVVGYRDAEGSVLPLRLVFTPGPTPRLQLGSREGVWTRIRQGSGAGGSAT